MKVPGAKVFAPRGNRARVARARLRFSNLGDLDLLVRHRRGMWEEIVGLAEDRLEAGDRAFRRWARTRLRSGTLVGFIVESTAGEALASGCLWLMPTQPRPTGSGTVAPYLMSMYTEPAHRGEGHGTRIVRAAIRWSRERGHGMVLLHASTASERLYSKEGFGRTREMRLSLHPGQTIRPRRVRKPLARRRVRR